MINTQHFGSSSSCLELCIRSALQSGYLSTALESQIKDLLAQGTLSERDRVLIQLLEDAIQEGCIRQL